MITKSELLVHILVTFFGIGSWLAINGSFVELPLMVTPLPEGWALASYIAVMTQLGNIGPLIVALYNRFAKRKLSDVLVVYMIYTLGAVACLLLSFFWDHVITIGGSRRSIPFFILIFFQAFVDCTSSVVFLPYMATLKPKYITTLFVGQGLSGVIPAFVGLIQGVGQMSCVNVTTNSSLPENGSYGQPITVHSDNGQTFTTVGDTKNHTRTHRLKPVYAEALFNVSGFYIFLTVLTVVCGFAFILINKLPLCRNERAPESKKKKSPIEEDLPSTERTPLFEVSSTDQSKRVTEDATSDREVNATKRVPEVNDPKHEHGDEADKYIAQDDKNADKTDNPSSTTPHTKDKLNTKTVIFCLCVFLIINALTNGILVSVQPYATIPYSLNTYHIITILFKIAPVFATSLAYMIAVKTLPGMFTLVLIGCGGSVYIVVAAVFSPTPWLAGKTSGAALMGCVWVMTSAVFSYVSVCVANVIRLKGRRALFWCGVMKQVGSAVGSLVMFLLVNLGNVFESAPKCPS